MASRELPQRLSEMEARWLSSRPATIDYRPRIDELEKQRANLVAAIKSGGLASELGAELKAISSDLEQSKALSQAKPQPRRAPQESVEQRVARMLDRLAQGGEIAQGTHSTDLRLAPSSASNPRSAFSENAFRRM
jgi:hypothetical protein